MKSIKKIYLITTLCFIGLLPHQLIAQDFKNDKTADTYDQYTPENYIGETINVTKESNTTLYSEKSSGYLETILTNNYFCFENKITISQIKSNIDNNSNIVTLDIKLNNEDMSKYITPEMKHSVQKFRQLSYSFSCEKKAIWIKATGQDSSVSDYQEPQFAFSFFAVPDARNLQKISVEN